MKIEVGDWITLPRSYIPDVEHEWWFCDYTRNHSPSKYKFEVKDTIDTYGKNTQYICLDLKYHIWILSNVWLERIEK